MKYERTFIIFIIVIAMEFKCYNHNNMFMNWIFEKGLELKVYIDESINFYILLNIIVIVKVILLKRKTT